MGRPPPGGRTPLDWRLWHLAGEKFPRRLRKFGYWYFKHIVWAVDVAGDEASEGCTSLVIQKFCNELRRNNVKVFSPFPVDLGGRYSFLLSNSIGWLIEAGILNLRSSTHRDIDNTVYEVNQKYNVSFDKRDTWMDVFNDLRGKFKLKNLFQGHDERRIEPWIKDREAYIWTNPDVIGLDNQENVIQILLRLIDKYKNIPREEERRKNDSEFKRAKRAFRGGYVNKHYDDPSQRIIGDLVFLVGFFDLAEERWQDSDRELLYLRHHPVSTESIGVEMIDALKEIQEDIYTISVGVFGIISESDGDPIVEPVGVLKSDELPRRIRELQQDERERQIQELKKEQTELLGNINRNLKEIKQLQKERKEWRKEILLRIKEAQSEESLDEAEREVLNRLKDLIITYAASKGIDWVIRQILAEYPEHLSTISRAIGL